MSNELTVMKKDVVDVVANRIRKFQSEGEINFPANYSPENALKSAWLILQETKDKDKKPVLSSCTKESIANTLLDMVIQGLNPVKKQCYFIAYGSSLTCQRSYFGTMHVAKTVNPNIEDIVGDVVYEDDEFEYEKQRGKTVITKHKQKLGNVDKKKISAAYATVLYRDGRDESMIMTMDEIKQAWKKSRIKSPVDTNGNIVDTSTHGEFTQEMAKKTVINRLCKNIINSSDDSNLIIRTAKASSGDMKTVTVEDEISQKANKELLDIDMETGEILNADYREMEEEMSEEEIAQAVREAEMAMETGIDF